jgi:hypothetical protein
VALLAAWTATTGWFGEKATPPVELLGLVVKATLKTLTIGVPAVRLTRLPPLIFDFAWKVVPETVGEAAPAVTAVPPPAYVIVNVLAGLASRHVMSARTVHGPLPDMELSTACEHGLVPLGATVMKPGLEDDELCGAVHPAGMSSDT